MPLKLQFLVSWFVFMLKTRLPVKAPLSPCYHCLFTKACLIKSIFPVPLLKGVKRIKHFTLKHDQIEMYVKK